MCPSIILEANGVSHAKPMVVSELPSGTTTSNGGSVLRTK